MDSFNVKISKKFGFHHITKSSWYVFFCLLGGMLFCLAGFIDYANQLSNYYAGNFKPNLANYSHSTSGPMTSYSQWISWIQENEYAMIFMIILLALFLIFFIHSKRKINYFQLNVKEVKLINEFLNPTQPFNQLDPDFVQLRTDLADFVKDNDY